MRWQCKKCYSVLLIPVKQKALYYLLCAFYETGSIPSLPQQRIVFGDSDL